MKNIIAAMLLTGTLLLPGLAHGKIVTETVDYKDGDTTLEGTVAYDDAIKSPKPGILIFHQWTGPSDHEQQVAAKLAELGYIAFVADVFGKGIRPEAIEDRITQVKKYKSDRALMRSRAQAALRALTGQPGVDPKHIVAMGYCFGGTTSLELARDGADLVGVVSFHGGLDTPTPEDAKNIKGKVLALHGADDPYVPAEQVTAFEKEMRDAGVDWQLIKYSGAVHAFTVKAEGNDNSDGAAYNEKADRRSWKAMHDFLDEVAPAPSR